MIPADLATRLRVLIASSIQPLEAVAPIPEDLPRYEVGQRFTAQIHTPLPDGTYRALVAGRTVTLALPDAAKSGDVLELVVTRNEDRTVFARIAEAPAQLTARPQLSTTGQFISQLLTGRFANAEPAPLAAGQPVLQTPPHKPAELASALRQAVTGSGLFFEAHQAQWAQGKLPLETLLREPQVLEGIKRALAQGEASVLDRLPAHVAAPLRQLAEAQLRAFEAQGRDPARGAAQQAADVPAPGEETQAADAASERGAIIRTSNLAVPERLMPLVHQQLETLATQQAVWQGQVWPGQFMEWSVLDPGREGSGEPGGERAPWQSSLKLSLPGLGMVIADLVLSPAGIAVRLQAEDEASAARMHAGSAELRAALEGAGLPVSAIAVIHHDQP